MAVLLALVSALAYGAADFVGGIASRARSSLVVTATSAAVGVVAFSIAAAVVPGAASGDALLWGAASGVVGMLAAASLYAALAIGPMAVVAPLTATISGATPVIWSIVGGDLPDAPTWVGLVAVLVGAALVSIVAGDRGAPTRPRARGIGLAVVAGVLFGAFYVFLAEAPSDSGMLPLLANRAAGLIVLGTVLVVIGLRRGFRGRLTAVGLGQALATGALDAIANALYVLAVREGALAVVAVIVSLYPAGTIALSAAVLRERISVVQWVGVGVALAGIVVLAL
ncbi:EamA family transporter [Schumannella luteola]